ncbi:ABC transporter ATP-binding protein [Actinophytocola sp.]|jgi:iron(III) transport system ATP-binding protein|uniref:ABC transporter ATP-binding protein n=1 Tax=Actinophytocola sp. TaxID=1872138 RepID=UPI002ED7C7EB
MTSLTVAGLTKSFTGAPVLAGVDLHVPANSLTAVLGPSGCGKTTLLRLIAGFADPDGGTIEFGDEVVFGPGRRVPSRRRRVGYVAQEGALFPHLSVAANITFGLPRRDRGDAGRVAALLELVGMPTALARRYPHELSGGQQQRVALARALAPEPSVVLLDEPFSALDAGLRESTRRAVREALRTSKATTILVTHDQAEALSLADQVGVLRDGRLAQLGSPAEVYGTPADSATAAFVGEAVLLPATIRDGLAECVLGTVPIERSTVEGVAQVLIRPEQLRLTPTATTGILARIRDVSYYGHDASVRLDVLPDGIPVTARIAGHELTTLNGEVRLTVVGRGLAYPATNGVAP